ncbi:MAG: dihydroorotase [Candidatus Thorarchaeota archaeon]
MTNEVDLVIRNARLLLETGFVHGGLAVVDGKISAIATDLHLPPAAETIDAHNKILMPGLIDGHAHLHDEAMLDHEDFTTGTMLAAAGGVTTVVEMPLSSQVDTPALVDEKVKTGERLAVTDFTLYGGMINSDNVRNIPALIERGVEGFKAFTCEPFYASAGVITKAMSEVSEFGGHLTIHSEDQGVLDEFAKDVDGDWDAPITHALARPALAEQLAVRQNIGIASKTGGHLHIAHITTREGVHEIAVGKQNGVEVTTEVCPHHLIFDRDEMNRLGPKSKMNPPLRSKQDRAALWAGLLTGAIDIVVSDHAPAPLEEKEKGAEDIRKAWAGVDGIQMILRVLLSEGINRGRLSWNRLLRITTRNPARIFGLYPKKGTFAIGADADLVLVEPTTEEKITSDGILSKSGWTFYDGMKMKGRPVMTFVRGKLVYQDGEIHVKPGHGQFQPMGRSAIQLDSQ